MIPVQGISWLLVRVRDEHFSYGGSDDVGVAGIPRYTTVATYTSIFDLVQDQCARPRTWAHFDYLIVLDDALVCVLFVCLMFAL